MTAQSFPLHWPTGYTRSRLRSKSQFKTSTEGAIKNVENSLALFAKDSGIKVSSVVVSSNYSLMDRNPADSGVAVYFTWDGITTCIAVDRYQKIAENLQAIHHCIEAERTKLRHGGLNLVRAAFRGYAALPPPSNSKEWWIVLDCDKNVTITEMETAYKAKVKFAHPDLGGSQAAMAELNAARDQARKELSHG